MIEWCIFALSFAGLVISLYFTFAYYGRVRHSRWIPQILCARKGSSCVAVVQTSYARVLGVPNSLLGIIYYLGLISWRAGRLSAIDMAYHTTQYVFDALALILPASVATVLLGFYLIHALRRKLHVDCPLCYTAHAINLAILTLLIVMLW